MNIKAISLDLSRPNDISLLGLRIWIVRQLNEYGKPLRWFISSVKTHSDNDYFIEVKVEAIVITN